MQLDLRTLCNALGFTVVVIHGHGMIRRKGEATRRALNFARLIEEFCLAQIENRAEPSREGSMAIVARMVDAIVEVVTAQEGHCKPDDLLAKGFTREEIDRHWRMAQALAYVKMNEPLPPADA
jgi:hypothetical protein